MGLDAIWVFLMHVNFTVGFPSPGYTENGYPYDGPEDRFNIQNLFDYYFQVYHGMSLSAAQAERNRIKPYFNQDPNDPVFDTGDIALTKKEFATGYRTCGVVWKPVESE